MDFTLKLNNCTVREVATRPTTVITNHTNQNLGDAVTPTLFGTHNLEPKATALEEDETNSKTMMKDEEEQQPRMIIGEQESKQ